MASSFKKRAASKPSYPRGTRPSFHNSSLLLSTGVPSLDAVLGGGVAVGTVLLIEEDTFGLYSRILLKYFLAEGVMCGHEVFVASAAEKPEHIVKDLPLPLDDGLHQATQPVRGEGRGREGGGEDQAKDMEIAWRYQKMPQVESSFSNRFGHLYDISRAMSSDLLSRATVHHFSPSPKDWDSELIQRIHETVEAQGFFVNQQCTGQRNLLRCAIHSLGTPLWGRGHSATPKFFHQLRALLRQSYAAALVTVPVHLFEPDAALVQRMERLSDSVVRLESFAGSGMEGNPLYKDYHGLVHLVKLPTVNTLLAHQPLTFDLAFKLKRKKFLIETLHLPPDLSETVSRAPVSAHSKSSSAQAANDIQTQSSTRKNKIDF